MKKITFIAPGNSIHSKRWIAYFENANYQTQWISFHKFKNNLNTSNKIFVESKILSLFFNNLIVLRHVKNFNSEIIHIHSLSKYMFSAMFLFFLKKKIVLTPWGSDINKSHGFKRIIINYFLKKASLVTTDSQIFRNEFLKINKNTKIINFGIDTDFFKPSKIKEENIIICPRGFAEIYRPFVILNAIKKVKFKIKNLKFIFIGDKEESQEILEYVSKENINGIVNILNLQDQDSYLKIINKSKGMISASISDAGIASSIAEFMSCNKIVIVTRNSDNHYWIKNGINGYLFENDNYSELAEIIVRLDRNIESINFNNRDMIIEKNDYLNEMKKMDQLYFKL